MTNTHATALTLRARIALTILAIDAIDTAADEALFTMSEVREAAYKADIRAKEAEALADAAPAFAKEAASLRRLADSLKEAAQQAYKRGAAARRRDALVNLLEDLHARARAAERYTAFVCEQRSEAAAQEAYLWA